jgi:hypothetical protein
VGGAKISVLPANRSGAHRVFAPHTLDPVAFVAAHAVTGGPAPNAVSESVASARATLDERKRAVEDDRAALADAAAELAAGVARLRERVAAEQANPPSLQRRRRLALRSRSVADVTVVSARACHWFAHTRSGGANHVLLVDKEVSVEFEVVRVRAEQSTGIGGAGKEVEALVLERLEIPRADMRIRVDLGKLDPAANRASRRQLPIA